MITSTSDTRLLSTVPSAAAALAWASRQFPVIVTGASFAPATP